MTNETPAPPKIARMQEQDGLYLVSSNMSAVVLPLLVKGGKVYSIQMDTELVPGGWPPVWRDADLQDTIQVRGPLSLTTPPDTANDHQALIEAVRAFLDVFLGQQGDKNMEPGLSYSLLSLITAAGLPLPPGIHHHG